MDVKIEMDAAAIERKVVESILESGIGKALKESIARVVPNITSTWQNGLDQYVKQVALEHVRKVVDAEYTERITEAVRAALTPEKVATIVKEAIDNLRVARY